jgi:AcrR family transcriptional regulator
MPKPASARTLAARDETDSLSRVERKRRDTRDRIVREAESLMRSRPIDDITIQDITDAADIGHGTFYLHFKSKYEVLIPIVEQEAIRWDEIIQRRVSDVDDPAVVLASSSRYMARVIVADPLWRWFLQHSGVPVDDMRQAIGRFGARDFGRGLMSGRFHVPELTIATSYMLGGFVNGLLASFDSANPNRTIDQMVEMLLRVIGLELEEAERIANLPLPKLE